MMALLILGAVFLLLRSSKAGSSPASQTAQQYGTYLTQTPTTVSPAVQQEGQQQTKETVAVASVTGAVVSGAGAAAAASTTGTFLALSATSWTIVGGVIAGAFLLFNALRSTTHLTANDFVQRFQNPFGDKLKEIFDPHDRRWASGVETTEGAIDTYNAIEFLWQEFQLAANQYATSSRDASIVVTQAYHTLSEPNGLPGWPAGFVPGLLRIVQERIGVLSGNPLTEVTAQFTPQNQEAWAVQMLDASGFF